MRSQDVIVQTISRSVSFIIFAFSFYLFLAGHNNPGGGFIGGLMTSAAIVLLYVSYDMESIDKAISIDYTRFTASGLLIAVLTGLGSLLYDAPFLSHAFGHFDLPLFGPETELATAVLFDIGVYLTVIGATMTIILTIGEDVE